MAKPSVPVSRLTVAPRTIIGYHGCSQETAERILEEQRFVLSTKAYDWLGEGVYFWEYAPYRALEWALVKSGKEGSRPAVLRATIRLGRCLNLLDVVHMPGLINSYNRLVQEVGIEQLPRNTARGAHYLDRLVIDTYCRFNRTQTFKPLQTVRGSFAEGEPLYPGSKILTKAHVQIAVRDMACITHISLVQSF